MYNTGTTLSVKYEGDDSSSSSSTASKTASATSSVTKPAQTVVVTAAPTETGSSGGGGSNTAGIVAGVVVGIVVIASAVGGGYLYMRRKRNKEIEEEHRRNAAVNAFVGKPPGSSAGSMTDSRMDPVMAHRRMSDGSIADNQDYSRRILRVCAFLIAFAVFLLLTITRSPMHDCTPPSDDDKRTSPCISL